MLLDVAKKKPVVKELANIADKTKSYHVTLSR